MLRTLPRYLVMLLSLALLTPAAHAQLYKWVDEKGEIHYGDKVPDQYKGSQIGAGDNSAATQRQSANLAPQPIIRPYEKTARKLHLLDARYLWKSESQVDRSTKIGVYHTGKGCTTRGAMRTPDVFIHHKSLFPSESELSYRITRVINGLDYEAERTEKYRLLSRLKKTGGLSLHAEIIELDVNTCAPGIRQSERLKPVDTIAGHRFKKNRVRLKVNWELRTNRDQDIVYAATTSGQFNGWNRATPAETAIGNALEAAVLQLFSDRDFIARVVVEEDGQELREIEYSGLKPINPESGKRTRKLFLHADGRSWIKNREAETQIGHMLFGDKCAAKRPMPLSSALASQKWLAGDALSTGNAITQKARPLGYAINPASADTLAGLEDSSGYSLNAKVIRVTYDACAPSLSASTKYKPLDKIPFRQMQRNRVQVWVEWTLASDRNRKQLYRTSTMGFAGSLIADTRGDKAMQQAIGMAAEQLFADRDFVNLITLAPQAAPDAQEFAARDNSSLRGIVLPQGQQPIKLILVADSNPWQRIPAQKTIGLYAYGADCSPYRERSWPQALNRHPRIFPDSGEILSAASKVVKSLGYPHQVADQHSVVSMKRKLGGYSLHADIVDMRFDACAPEVDDDVVYQQRKVSTSQFKRHRAVVRINWKLNDGNDETLFQRITEGVVDSWLLNSSGKQVFTLAVANATSQLFTSEDFVANLVVDEADDGGFFSSLLSFLGSDDDGGGGIAQNIGNRYVLQAHAAQAFSEISVLKVGSVQHYMMEGDWPSNLSEMGYSETLFNDSETIDYVSFQPDGSMVVELKELFGNDKVITLRPNSANGDMTMNRWHCSSNLEQSYLPQNCEGL